MPKQPKRQTEPSTRQTRNKTTAQASVSADKHPASLADSLEPASKRKKLDQTNIDTMTVVPVQNSSAPLKAPTALSVQIDKDALMLFGERLAEVYRDPSLLESMQTDEID